MMIGRTLLDFFPSDSADTAAVWRAMRAAPVPRGRGAIVIVQPEGASADDDHVQDEDEDEEEIENEEKQKVADEPYYATNFDTVARTVLQTHAHIFLPAERDMVSLLMLSDGGAVSPAARRLFLRLAQRKGPVFRVASLAYPETEPTDAAATELVAAGLARWVGDDDAEVVLTRLLATADLRSLWVRYGTGALSRVRAGHMAAELATVVRRGLVANADADADRPRDVVAALGRAGAAARHRRHAAALVAAVRQMAGRALVLQQDALRVVRRCFDLFFLNPRAESDDREDGAVVGRAMSALVLRDMRRIRYASYAWAGQSTVYADRDALLEHELWLGREARFAELLAPDADADAGTEGDDDGLLGEPCLGPVVGPVGARALVDAVTDDSLPPREARGILARAVAAVAGVVAANHGLLLEDEPEPCAAGARAARVPLERPFLSRYHAQYAATRTASLGVAWLERERRHDAAAALLRLLLGYCATCGRVAGPCGEAEPESGGASAAAGDWPQRASWWRGPMAVLAESLGWSRPPLDRESTTIQPWLRHRRGEWWNRLAIDLGHLGRGDESRAASVAGLADTAVPPRCGARRELARRMARATPAPRPVAAATAWRERRLAGRVLCRGGLGRHTLFVPASATEADGKDEDESTEDETMEAGTGVGVETLALQYYASAAGGAWRGAHAENCTLRILFGVLMWDVLFAAVPGVFQTPFQDAPLDLGTPEFARSRARLLMDRLNAIHGCQCGGACWRSGSASGSGPDPCCCGWEPEWPEPRKKRRLKLRARVDDHTCATPGELVRECWAKHHGEQCRGVRWDAYSETDLATLADCIGGRALAGAFWLLAQDYGAWSRGMPDLILWSERSPAARAVEVKGPGDRLSEPQRAWLEALCACGLDCEVCFIR